MARIYRGKAKNGEWGYGSYLRTDSLYDGARGLHRDWIIESAGQSGGMVCLRKKFAVMPETVGQYTGLADKNGKKIFEGDIVRINNCAELAYLVFEEFQWVFKMPALQNWRHRLEDNPNKYEVVGNIYDNPDLLEELK